LLTKKPDARTQQMYGQYAIQASQVCMYLFEHHACPPKDGAEQIDLDDERNRSSLVGHIIAKIEELDLASLAGAGKSRALRDLAQSEIANSSSVTAVEGDAGMILSLLNIIDMLARHYYELYPGCKPMLELVNDLAKVCPTGMQVVFGDDLPVEVRRAFPHYSSLFEQNRANF